MMLMQCLFMMATIIVYHVNCWNAVLLTKFTAISLLINNNILRNEQHGFVRGKIHMYESL